MSQKTYLNILKGGIYFSLLVVFFVFKNWLFPFITSKQVSFNVIMEVLFVFWAALVIKYPEYRPKKNYIAYGFAVFFVILIISSIVGVDFNLSFWGDIERMLGVFHALHFFIFYLIIITVFKRKIDWQILLGTSCFFALIIAIQALTQTPAYATIGNTAYVSGYMIFHIYFSFLLFAQSKNIGNWRYLFLAGVPFYVISLNVLNTSGAIVGLGASALLVLFLYGILHNNQKVKIATLSVFFLTGFFFLNFFVFNRTSSIVENNATLKKLVTIVNVNKVTFQTRLISWKAAFKDYKNHPYLGTGFGNYAIIFDKGFDPKFYDYTRGETYFDRAHNNLVDLLSTSGILGLISYLLVFVAAGYYLIAGYRKGKINLHEFVIISGCITGYFIQNLAIFDSLVTYMGLMITLGMVYYLYAKDDSEPLPRDRELDNREIYALAGVGLVILVILYQYNIKVAWMLDGTIAGQRAFAAGDIDGTIKEYQKALSYDTPLDRDSRTSLNRLFTSIEPLSKIPVAHAKDIIDYNIDLAKKNVDYNPEDSLDQLMLAQLLNVAAQVYKDDKQKFSFYSEQSMESINKAIAASPGRIPVYYQKAQFYLTRGDNQGALNTLKEAAALSSTYYDSFCYLGRTELFLKNEKDAWPNLDKCIDLGGTSVLADNSLIKSLINRYLDKKDMKRVTLLYEYLVTTENTYENWVKLAQLYAGSGEKDKAREAVGKAVELNPKIEKDAQDFLNKL